jgi:uncharacterized tellurite resistance protein B-like protein
LVQIEDDVEEPYDGDEQLPAADQNSYSTATIAANNDALNNQVQKEHFATQVDQGQDYADMDYERRSELQKKLSELVQLDESYDPFHTEMTEKNHPSHKW